MTLRQRYFVNTELWAWTHCKDAGLEAQGARPLSEHLKPGKQIRRPEGATRTLFPASGNERKRNEVIKEDIEMNVKGTLVEIEELPSKAFFRQPGLRLPALLFVPMLFSACVHWPDIASDCESYGVVENYVSLGNVTQVQPLYRKELEEACAGVDFSNAAHGTEISGCTIPQADGKVDVFYWVGDRCAMNHELCHAKHGAGHTDRYLQELKDGVPMPYCPQNQLTLGLSK